MIFVIQNPRLLSSQVPFLVGSALLWPPNYRLLNGRFTPHCGTPHCGTPSYIIAHYGSRPKANFKSVLATSREGSFPLANSPTIKAVVFIRKYARCELHSILYGSSYRH
jgi:hypothetical protein